MRVLKKIKLIFFSIFCLTIGISCQKDINILEETTPTNATGSISNISTVTTLIKGVTELDDDDISCVDFKYPITFYTYNANNQQTGITSVNTDTELYNLLDDLEDEDRLSIQYPITLINADSTETIINDNETLENTLDTACDDDDDSSDDDSDDDTTDD